ncbi:copper chaperone for superoxide dismutase [Apteryx rowi]|uniref:copper chaperone for superoxide dismutase n=1 Tax=Apteryx rowi TaxID=308060 RepID=UPI000E1D72D3|nr:copper chaperone for superoxide dismutase [Apteryx rowi]
MAEPGPAATSCRLEFSVQMTCESCVEAVREALQGLAGVRVLDVRLDSQTVLVEASVAAERVRERLEASGRRVVLRGMGGPSSPGRQGPAVAAAVAALRGPGEVRGLLRFVQVSPERCLVEGTVDGLQPGPHGLHVHEFGDLSDACDSCGDHFNPDGERHGGPQDEHRHVGDLGNIWADATGRAALRLGDRRLCPQVWHIIGRSVVVDAGEDDLGRGSHPLSGLTGNSGPRLACGVVARAAGLFENPKRICTCDGLTLWDERDRERPPGQPAPHL